MFSRTLLILLVFSHAATAKPIPELRYFAEHEIESISKALNETDTEVAERNETTWEFKKFLLRISANFAFDINVVTLALVPELELVWLKKKPE